MTKCIAIALVVYVFAAYASAQQPDTANAKRVEMKKVEKLVGRWTGSGWIQQGPKRETFTGSENVQMKLDGLAILVEGNFSNPGGKAIHQTLAVLSCNEKLNGFNFATYLANGITGNQEFKVVGDHYEWGFQIPNVGTVRYSIKADNDVWSETGEFSKDGKTWFKNFEMTLNRQK